MNVMQNYTLGPLPWSEAVLRQAYFRSFTDAQKSIQEHPGFTAHRELYTLQLSLDIFLNSVSELCQSIDTFRIDAHAPSFWTRPAQSQFKNRELGVRRGVFAVATSALALVDHSRKVQKRVAITKEEYARQLKETFDEYEHRFIQSLRVG